MDMQSIKTRLVGSYLFLLVLFIVQVPIIYVIVGGMIDKYSQVEEAGSLRKRAAEITEILNRHVMTGDEKLEQVFQGRKAEYGEVISKLRRGNEGLEAITDVEILGSLDGVEKEWSAMKVALDKAMDLGDGLRMRKGEVEEATGPLVAKLNDSIKYFEGAGLVNQAGMQRMRVVKLSYLLERYLMSYSDRDEITVEIRKTVDEFEAAFATLKAASFSKGEGASGAAREIDGMWQAYFKALSQAVKSNDSYHAQITALVDKHTPAVIEAANGLTKLIAAHAKESARRGIWLMAASVVVCAAFSAFFIWMAKTQMIAPLLRIRETVDSLASGDLTNRADVKIRCGGWEIKDEIAGLGVSVDAMAGQMSGMIGRITETAGMLSCASEELSSSSRQITEGAKAQSSRTVQVATAMEEMNATVIEVAKNSQQASESAIDAKSIASKGGQVVESAIEAMVEVSRSASVTAETVERLGRKSEEIGTIVSVINDIADQTNLLALNAAIEAARAGDQGRGFAVVADEVRRLAERTTSATREISVMIRSIQDETSRAVEAMSDGTLKVENGVRLANEAGEALRQIVSGVDGVTDMIGHIATSAEEQSATTGEITMNIDSIAEVAKTNVNTISEVAKATDELSNLATGLKDLVANFRIAGDGLDHQKRTLAEIRNIRPSKEKTNLFEPRIITAQRV